VTLSITLDNYPEETSWTLTNDGGQTIASGGTYGSQPDGSTVTETICLVDDCYTFTINDTYGDGICCGFGNGSYSLTNGGTVLASGGSFTSSEATDFCIGGSGADTTPPTDPTGLSVSNEQDTQVTLSWNASSDNVGVTGYEVFSNGSSIGTVTGTSANVTGLSTCTTYSFGVRALDAAGNASGQDTASGTTTGCSTADTTPPSDPTNLTVSNEQDTQVSLSWNASSDNVGVTGYEIFSNGSSIGTVTGTTANVTGLSACTTYSFGVRAFDAAGNNSGQATASGTTTGCSGGGGFTEGYFFETGLDGWTDGGSDCARVASSTRSYEGSYSVRIRDNSGTASSMTSPSYDLAGLASVEVTFFFYPNSMETGEDFWLRYNDGSGWQTVATYTSGTSFNNNSFYTATVTLDGGSTLLTNGAQFRFQCDASANADRIYIDQVTVTGNAASGSNATEGTISTIEEVMTIQRFDSPDDDEFDVKIAPNPASDIINVTAEEEIKEVSIYSVDGKLLMHRVYEGTERVTMKVSDLPTGMYLVSVLTVEERNTERVVIRR
jgi:chitodextrinase